MNAARLAELYRERAAHQQELARLDGAIAEELAGESNSKGGTPANDVRRTVPVRPPYKPPPRVVSDIARAKAEAVLKKKGVT